MRRALGADGQAKLVPLTPRERKLVVAGLALLLALTEEENSERSQAISSAALLMAAGRGEIPVSRLPSADPADPSVPFAEVVRREVEERAPEIAALLRRLLPGGSHGPRP